MVLSAKDVWGLNEATPWKRRGFNPWVRKIPWRRKWQPTPVFLPGESLWTEKPGRLQSIGWQKVRHDWSDWACTHSLKHVEQSLENVRSPFAFGGCSVAQSCLILCDPVDCSTPGLLVLHSLPEFAQVHVHWISDAFQPSHPLSPSSPFAFNLSQHQGLLWWVSYSCQVAKVLEFQLWQ